MKQTVEPDGWRLRLAPDVLTPDPSHGRPVPVGDDVDCRLDVYPWRMVRCLPTGGEAQAWASRLDGETWPGALVLQSGGDGVVSISWLSWFGSSRQAGPIKNVSGCVRCSVLKGSQ
jgi:hypothetical protein